MIDERLDIRAQRQLWRNSVEILVVIDRPGSNKISVGQPITMVDQDREFLAVEQATMELRIPQAQQLMDELWRCGLRPTEGTGSAGALAAVEKHLADMRRIAFEFTDAALLKDQKTAMLDGQLSPIKAGHQEFKGFVEK